MLLTRRTLLLLLLAAAPLAGATIEPLLLYVTAGYLTLVLAMILTDWRISPRPQEFEVGRINDERLSLGADNLVSIRVTQRGRRRTELLVRDEYPIEFSADRTVLGDSDAEAAGRPAETIRAAHSSRPVRPTTRTIKPRVATVFQYHVRPPRRGDYRFGDINLRWQGALGLVVRQARFPASEPVKVYPNLLDIRKYELLVRRGQLREMGLRQTRMLGGGTEFERLREYQLDDDFRRIDWKAMARHGKPITREFEAERSQNIMVLLDVGRLMRSPVGDPESGLSLAKVDYAVNAVLMLSYVAALRGDRVGMLSFADDVTHYLPPKSGKGQFYRMLALLYAVKSQPVEADYGRAFAYLGAKHKKRSLIVIFSDLASGLAARSIVTQVAPLWPRHLPLFVAISDPAVVALAGAKPVDSASVYQRAVAEQLLDERSITMESLRRRGVLTLDVPAHQLTISVVNKYLELKARNRI